ncbi:TetR/AcrR family transcriptional regulator [Streptomyces botrytidirepellens]|uniref:TetR family transcriptional regulator n=1 Tax=Streptomyces botrytidirepellens TaxID=2486417 RepID=A0A3M8VUT4_9ACTN|nr:TetR family transcriptional regulator [Streptomyces botrytidirepellens]RNG20339.1 TetR family transcriptional regulator [Streptomyces botrytidirepellens]
MIDMASAHTTPAGPRPGLRERKKIQTRQAIRRAAYRLFADQGYDATPVDRIAEAADVSTSTVFRYFPTKEDIVLTDEYDEAMAAGIRDRPLDEPPVSSLRRVLIDMARQLTDDERAEMLTRLTLIRQVPALRARMGEGMAKTGTLLGEVLAERSGRSPEDLEVRVLVGAVLGALQEAVFHSFDHHRVDAMEDDIDRALGMLARGLPL